METGIYNHTKAGTIGGTVLVLLLHINSLEIIQTVLMAAIGAATSFTVSMLLRYLMKRYNRK
jgi:hypothetical protein